MSKENNDLDALTAERERLIVPEEIFAPELPDPEDEPEVHDDAPEDSPDADEEITDESDDYRQIAFFDEDPDVPREPEADSTDWESLDEDGFDGEHPRLVDKIFDFVELISLTLIAVLVCSAFLFRHAVVDGSSMVGTLEDGEHLIVSSLFYTPERGDIIVFEDHTLPENLRDPIVKRIIALEGDTVMIDELGIVYVNGYEYSTGHEYYLEGYYITDLKPYYYAQGYEYTVPEGHVFVLGDNRNHSTDSRVIGPIDMDTVLGEVLLRIYPFDGFGKI